MEQPTLTPRQLEVVRRLALGHPTDAIARDLRISKNTLYNHLWAAIERNGACDRYELWMRLGWLKVPTAPDAMPAARSSRAISTGEREPSGANTR